MEIIVRPTPAITEARTRTTTEERAIDLNQGTNWKITLGILRSQVQNYPWGHPGGRKDEKLAVMEQQTAITPLSVWNPRKGENLRRSESASQDEYVWRNLQQRSGWIRNNHNPNPVQVDRGRKVHWKVSGGNRKTQCHNSGAIVEILLIAEEIEHSSRGTNQRARKQNKGTRNDHHEREIVFGESRKTYRDPHEAIGRKRINYRSIIQGQLQCLRIQDQLTELDHSVKSGGNQHPQPHHQLTRKTAWVSLLETSPSLRLHSHLDEWKWTLEEEFTNCLIEIIHPPPWGREQVGAWRSEIDGG